MTTGESIDDEVDSDSKAEPDSKDPLLAIRDEEICMLKQEVEDYKVKLDEYLKNSKMWKNNFMCVQNKYNDFSRERSKEKDEMLKKSRKQDKIILQLNTELSQLKIDHTNLKRYYEMHYE